VKSLAVLAMATRMHGVSSSSSSAGAALWPPQVLIALARGDRASAARWSALRALLGLGGPCRRQVPCRWPAQANGRRCSQHALRQQ